MSNQNAHLDTLGNSAAGFSRSGLHGAPHYSTLVQFASAVPVEHPLNKSLEALELAETRRRQVAAVLVDCSILDSDYEPTSVCDPVQRVAVEGVNMPAGTLLVNGRALRSDWLACPAKLGANIAACCSAWKVGQVGAKFKAQPHKDGSSLCPACARMKAVANVKKFAPIVEALAAAGFELAMLTKTLFHEDWGNNGDGNPVLLTEWERSFYSDSTPESVPIDGVEHGYATSGEALLSMFTRYRKATRKVRNDSGSKRWWADTVIGSIEAMEWTGHGLVDGKRVPRWHVHGHDFIVLRKGHGVVWDADGIARRDVGWLKTFQAHWVARGGGPMVDLRRVDAGGIVEVLKYPFKVGTLTNAQVVEVLCATKGLSTRVVTGLFHGGTRLGKAVGQARELAAVGDGAGVARIYAGLSIEDESAVRAVASVVVEKQKWSELFVEVETPKTTARMRTTAIVSDGRTVHVAPLYWSFLKPLADGAVLTLWKRTDKVFALMRPVLTSEIRYALTIGAVSTQEHEAPSQPRVPIDEPADERRGIGLWLVPDPTG